MMSRTDVHRPIWVQYKDSTIRHWFRDHHDHRDGVCDFDQFLATKDWSTWMHTNCRLDVSAQCPCLCGCDMCTGRPWDKLRRRRERHQWKAIRRRLLAGEEIEVGPIRADAW